MTQNTKEPACAVAVGITVIVAAAVPVIFSIIFDEFEVMPMPIRMTVRYNGAQNADGGICTKTKKLLNPIWLNKMALSSIPPYSIVAEAL